MFTNGVSQAMSRTASFERRTIHPVEPNTLSELYRLNPQSGRKADRPCRRISTQTRRTVYWKQELHDVAATARGAAITVPIGEIQNGVKTQQHICLLYVVAHTHSTQNAPSSTESRGNRALHICHQQCHAHTMQQCKRTLGQQIEDSDDG